MAVSKRLRFEILKRDNHTCRYCGGTAPDVVLTVDHVIPVSLGGSDDPSNLVAACKDCNAGKTSSNPDAPLVETVADDALRWAAAMKQAADERAASRAESDALYAQFSTEWGQWTSMAGGELSRPPSWRATIDQLLDAGLEMGDLLELVRVAMDSRADDVWRYFCGCCWTRIRKIQERAAEITRGDPQPAATLTVSTTWTHDDLDTVIDGAVALAQQARPEFSRDSLGEKCGHGYGCADVICQVTSAAVLISCINQAREAALDG